MSYSSITAGAAFIRISLQDAALKKGLDNATKNMDAFGKRAKIAMDRVRLFAASSLDSFLTLGAPIQNAVMGFTRFDDTLRTLRAVSGGTRTELAGVEQKIRDLGKTTAFSSQQIAEGAVELSRMGFEVDELDDSLEPMLNLVRATGEETFRLKEISGYAASAMRIFQLRSEKTADTCDVLAYAANKSSVDIGDLGHSMKIAGPSAHTVNESLRDTAAALMLLSNAGIKGELAGTSLRKIYQSLAAVSGKTDGMTLAEKEAGNAGKKQLQEMGIKITDDRGNLRKAADIMIDMAKYVKDMKSGQKINFATDVFDLRGSLGALTMLADPGKLKEFRDELNNVSGYAQKTAKDIDSGPGQAFRRFNAQLNDLKLSAGDFFAQALLPLAEAMGPIVLGLSDVMKNTDGLSSTVATATFSVIAFGAGLRGLVAVVDALKTGFSPLFSSIKTLDQLLTGRYVSAQKQIAITRAEAVATANAEALKRAEYEKTAAARKLAKAESKLQSIDRSADPKEYSAAQNKAADAQNLLNTAIKTYNDLRSKGITASDVLDSKNKRHIETLARYLKLKKDGNLTERQSAQLQKLLAGNTLKNVLAAMAMADAANKASIASALWAKVTAGLSVSMKAFGAALLANPVGAFLTAMSLITAAVTYFIKRAEKAIRAKQELFAQGTNSQTEFVQKNDAKRADAETDFERLKQLEEISKKTRLNAEEMAEAQALLNKMSIFGSRSWSNLDKAAGKLTLTANANEKLKKSLKDTALKDVEKQIAAYKAELSKLRNDESGKAKTEFTDYEANRMAELEELQRKAVLRRGQILKNNDEAITGKKGKTTADRVAEYKNKLVTSQEELDKALKRTADIEAQVSKRNQTSIEKEIEKLKKMREEYLKTAEQLGTIGDDKTQAVAQSMNQQIKDLQAKALKEFEQYSPKVKKQEESRLLAERKRDQEISQMSESGNYSGAIAMVESLRKASEMAWQNAQKSYNDAYNAAYADKNLSDDEKANLAKLDEARSAEFQKNLQYQDKLKEIRNAQQNVQDKTSTIGSWSAANLAQALGGTGNPAERTARATEETVKLLKKNNKKLDKNKLTLGD